MRTAHCPASSGWRSRRPVTCATARTRTSEVALYAEVGGRGALGGANVLQGKEMSFNNWLDADAAYGLGVGASPRTRRVIVKHNNPCGVALGATRCRGVREGVRVRPGVGVRRDRGVQRRVRRAAAAAMARACSPRSWSRRRFTRRGAGGVRRSATNLAWCAAPLPHAGAGSDVRPIDGGALIQDRGRRDRDARATGRSSRRASPPRRSGATCCSRGRSRGG